MSALKKYRYKLNMKRLLAMDAFSVLCGNFLKCKILFDNQIHVYFFLYFLLTQSPPLCITESGRSFDGRSRRPVSLCLDESCDPDLGRCILCGTTSKKMFIKQNIESYGKDGYF